MTPQLRCIHILQSVLADFWEVLHSSENQSLWNNFQCEGDGKWIYQGMILGTLGIVHEGSYMPKVSEEVCSEAFMILDTHTGKRAKGVVAEKSKDAPIQVSIEGRKVTGSLKKAFNWSYRTAREFFHS